MMKTAIDIICVAVEIFLLRHLYTAFFQKCQLSKNKEILLYIVLGILAYCNTHANITMEQRMVFSFLIDIAPALFYRGQYLVKLFLSALYYAIQITCELFAWAFLALLSGDLTVGLNVPVLMNYIQGVFLSKALAAMIIFFIAGLQKQQTYHGKKLLLCTYMLLPVITIISLDQVAYATDLL